MSKKGESISLLQMYDDDDDDIDMDDVVRKDDEEEEEEAEDEVEVEVAVAEERESEEDKNGEESSLNPNDVVLAMNLMDTNAHTPPVRQLIANTTPNWGNLRPPTPLQLPTQTDAPRQRRETPSIVDYGHDDVAMSPEPEEGEILASSLDGVMSGEEPANANDISERTPIGNVQIMAPTNQMDSPQPCARDDVSQADMINGSDKESIGEAKGQVNICDEDAKEVVPFDKFLPPPPVDKCPDELQEKINKFLAYKRQGKIFNVEVRNRKDYRNPDFLRHAVRYQEIDEIGSNFSKDVFDPHGYDESDYYDAIEADMKREMERKEQERKKSPKVDFVSGGTQATIVNVAQKVKLPSPSVPNLPPGGLQSGSTDALTREGRQNKKSKWDKVDGDGKNLMSGGQDGMSAVGAHAALLSAANAGAGYTIFAQQKRREAEEKRSSDKKLERRS